METGQNLDLSSITVKVWAAHEHHWVSGQELHHIPIKHPRAVLLHQLWLIQDGFVEFQANGKEWKVNKGEACFLPVTSERQVTTPEPASWLSIRLWITLFTQFNPMQNVSLPIIWRPDKLECSQMESWMKQIVRHRPMNAAYHSLVVDGLAQAVYDLCWPYLNSSNLNSPIHFELPAWLEQTLRRISTDLTCNIADLAHDAGFSPAQFRRSFRNYVGSTPRDYVKSQRLETMRHFLEHTDLPLRAIAERVGLRDVNHFTQVFKVAYGMPPSTYRGSLRNGK